MCEVDEQEVGDMRGNPFQGMRMEDQMSKEEVEERGGSSSYGPTGHESEIRAMGQRAFAGCARHREGRRQMVGVEEGRIVRMWRNWQQAGVLQGRLNALAVPLALCPPSAVWPPIVLM